MTHAHIQTIIQLFVRKDKQDRLLMLAGSKKRFADFRHDLLHDSRYLNREQFTEIPQISSADDIIKQLRASGAGKQAYCISEISDIDQREMDLSEALQRAVGHESDTIIFSVGSKVVYYENHEGERFMLVQH